MSLESVSCAIFPRIDYQAVFTHTAIYAIGVHVVACALGSVELGMDIVVVCRTIEAIVENNICDAGGDERRNGEEAKVLHNDV